MPRIRLVKPTLAHESAIRAYLDAIHAAGLPLHGAVLEQFPDVASWIAFCDAPGGTLMPNGVTKVADSTYLAWDDTAAPGGALMPNGVAKVADSTYLAWDDTAAQMRGIINIRHELNEFLRQYGGHIGYSVHPACWNQGYATEMLALALQQCDALGLRELLLTCSPDNPASRRVIEKNGGVLENIVEFQGNPVCHYRIRRGA